MKFWKVLKNPKFDHFWAILGPFWSVASEPEFSHIWDLTRETNNHMNFHSKLNPAKTNDKFFQNNQKNLFLGHFGPILPIFGQIWIFIKNPFLPVFFISDQVLLCKISEKTNEQILRYSGFRRTDGRTHGHTDGRTWIYRTLPACRGSKKRVFRNSKSVCFKSNPQWNQTFKNNSI